MLLWGHPLMKLFVLIVSPSVSFLFEITISARPARHDIQSPLSVTFYTKRRAITLRIFAGYSEKNAVTNSHFRLAKSP